MTDAEKIREAERLEAKANKERLRQADQYLVAADNESRRGNHGNAAVATRMAVRRLSALVPEVSHD